MAYFIGYQNHKRQRNRAMHTRLPTLRLKRINMQAVMEDTMSIHHLRYSLNLRE